MKLAQTVTLPFAIERIGEVGAKVGGPTRQRFARELRAVAQRLAEGSKWGPRHAVWPVEAGRLALMANVAEHGFERQQALLRAQRIAAALPGLQAKAVDADDLLELTAVRLALEALIGAETESMRLDPRGKAADFEGKAVAGMTGWQEKCFCDLIEDLFGRGPADGHGTLGREALLAHPADFDYAADLIYGERAPANEREAVALRTFRQASGWTPPGKSP